MARGTILLINGQLRLTAAAVFLLLLIIVPHSTTEAVIDVSVSAGYYHTCGLTGNGTVACWGAGKTNTGVFPEYGQSIPSCRDIRAGERR